MVDLLAVDLCSEACDGGIVGVFQRRDPDLVGGLVEPAARDRVRPVEEVELRERRAAVLVQRSVERECVGVAVLPVLPDYQLVESARVPDLVLGDGGERDVQIGRASCRERV